MFQMDPKLDPNHLSRNFEHPSCENPNEAPEIHKKM